MKFCPTCQTRYDEEILRFCTKDGTPLVEDEQPAQPAFTALPSEESGADDFSEETIIRRSPPVNAAVVETVAEPTQPLAPQPRIVIPTVEEKKTPPPPVRTKTVTEYRAQPRKTNTTKIVFLTLLGIVGALGAALFLLMLSRTNNNGNAVENSNVNANFNSFDTNLNSNLSIGNTPVNFNGNFNANSVSNININAGIKTPTPKPTATATAPPMLNSNINLGNSTAPSSPKPTATPTAPTATPTPTSPKPTTTPPPPPPARPTPSDTPDSRPVNAGVLNGRAVNLPKPAYPPIARQLRAAGQVAVQVKIDESGNVTSAKATSGNALLRAPAEAAARQSKINPITINDRNVQAVGILIYNFVNP